MRLNKSRDTYPILLTALMADLFEGLLDGRKKVEVGAYDGFT
jgi:hypothetical protein